MIQCLDLKGQHQQIKKEIFEFCYKFNRRYFGEFLFDRLLVACASHKNQFR